MRAGLRAAACALAVSGAPQPRRHTSATGSFCRAPLSLPTALFSLTVVARLSIATQPSPPLDGDGDADGDTALVASVSAAIRAAQGTSGSAPVPIPAVVRRLDDDALEGLGDGGVLAFARRHAAIFAVARNAQGQWTVSLGCSGGAAVPTAALVSPAAPAPPAPPAPPALAPKFGNGASAAPVRRWTPPSVGGSGAVDDGSNDGPADGSAPFLGPEDEALRAELRSLLPATADAPMAAADIYLNLSAAGRMAVRVRHASSVARAARTVGGGWEFVVVAAASVPGEPATERIAHRAVAAKAVASGRFAAVAETATRRSPSLPPAAPPAPRHGLLPAAPRAPVPTVKKVNPPPPPPSTPPPEPLPEADAGWSVQRLISAVPTFFVPVSALIAEALPGYTEQHFDTYFGRSVTTAQMRVVCGRRFVRLHGGWGLLDFTKGGAVEAAAVFAPRFAVDAPALVPAIRAIIQAMASGPGEWVPCSEVLLRLPPEAAEKVPLLLPRPPSLGESASDCAGDPVLAGHLLFSQLQHEFAYVSDGDGSVAIPPEPVTTLVPEASPCPLAHCEMMRLCAADPLDATLAVQRLSPYARQEIERCFGPGAEGMAAFYRAHGPGLFVSHDARLVMQTRRKESFDRKSWSLQEQLDYAIETRNKHQVRRLRRKMIEQQNPENPFLANPEILAEKIAEYLPRRRCLSIRSLLRSMPFELSNCLPIDYMKFFKRYPRLFSVFELHYANNIQVQRADLPLPMGHLRTEYTDNECVLIIADRLRRHAQTVSELSLWVPRGVRELTKKRGGMLRVVLAFPQFFSTVFRSDDAHDRENMALVTLLAMPAVDSNGSLIVAENHNDNYQQSPADDGDGGEGSDSGEEHEFGEPTSDGAAHQQAATAREAK